MALTKITQEELVSQLRNIAEQMHRANPQECFQGLVALQALLTRYELKHDLVSVSADLAPRVITLVWLLQQFVNEGLWKNFGAGNTGFPETEGEPSIRQISYYLGGFILWFLEEEVMPFIAVMAHYFQLLRLTEHAYLNPNPETRWVTL